MQRSLIIQLLLIILSGNFQGIAFTQSSQFDSTDHSRELINAIHQAKRSIVSIHVFGKSHGQIWNRIGTGFVYNPNGLVVTHQRVIERGDSICVVLANGKHIRAWFVHSDINTGVALLQTIKPLKHGLKFYKPGILKPDSKIYILGNSLGVFPSLTQGFFTGKQEKGSLILDIATPPGNCGSPVFDFQGNVIGLLAGYEKMSRIGSSLEQFNRTAVPIENVHQLVELISNRFDDRKGWIGITVVDIRSHSRPGVRVVDIVPKGPADKAHICKGDTIIAFNKEPVPTAKNLALRISETNPGDKISFKIRRKGKTTTHSLQVRYAPWRYQVQKAKIP